MSHFVRFFVVPAVMAALLSASAVAQDKPPQSPPDLPSAGEPDQSGQPPPESGKPPTNQGPPAETQSKPAPPPPPSGGSGGFDFSIL